MTKKKKKEEKTTVAAQRNARKTLTDFRKEHDRSYIVPRLIKAALAELGKDAWEYETVFVKKMGIAQAELNLYRDQFEEYIVEIRRGGKKVWAGSRGLAERMREMVL